MIKGHDVGKHLGSRGWLSPAFDETNMVAFREKKQEEEAKQQKRPVGTYSCSLEQEKVA
jgi:hypothetical protein